MSQNATGVSAVSCRTGIKLNDAKLRFLSEVEYVVMQYQPFSGVEFTVGLANLGTNLQVLVLQGLNVPGEFGMLHLDYFCELLFYSRRFWSRFRMLKI